MFGKVLLLAVALLTLLLTTSASAAPKQVVSTFGAAGGGDGELTAPTGGVAVRQGTGSVYVVDAGADRVQRFSATGAYEAQFGASGSGDGQFSFGGNPAGIAVDQADGSVYVADTANNRVQKLTAAGGYVSQFGSPGAGDGELSSPIAVAVDPTSHKVFVADRDNHRIQRFSAAGAFEAQFGTAGSGYGELSSPIGVAVDSTGSVYVVDSGNSRVQKFTSNGALQGVFASGTLNLSPQAITIDAATDHVLVSQYAPDFSGTQIVELTSAGNVVETHGTALPGAGGIDVRASTGRLYASDAYGSRILTLDAAVVPDVTISGATAVTPTTATVNGSINPHDGQPVTYHFETSTDQATWVPTPDSTPISGNADTPVTADLTGLQPNTPYFVRLVATPALNPAVTSSEQTFTTQTAAPAVVTTGPKDIGADKATLTGTIDPQGSPTTYYFEYGTTTAYGTSIPAAQDADAGAANDAQAVSREVTSLSAGITYHYRLVGHNGAGTTTGADRSFTPQAVDTLPDGRAYEQVTPVDKNGAEPQNPDSGGDGPQNSQVSSDGEAIAYQTIGAFPDGEGNTRATYHLSRRGANGWTTVGLNPPRDAPDRLAVTDVLAISADMSKALVFSTQVLAAGGIEGMGNMYVRDTKTGAAEFVAATSDPRNLDGAIFLGGSRDLGRIVFQLTDVLAPGAIDGNANAYQWSPGHITLVATYSVYQPLNGSYIDAITEGQQPIASDGSRVFVHQPGPLLAAGPDQPAVPISISHRTGAEGTVVGVGTFFANSSDGRRAVFSAAGGLTDDSPTPPGAPRSELYRVDLGTGSMDNLTATINPSVSQNIGGVPSVSADTETVYFTTYVGTFNDDYQLFVSRGGQVHRIATTTATGAPGTRDGGQASPNGRYFVFRSSDDLTNADTGGFKQLYRYDADLRQLDCVTCRADGAPSRTKGPISSDRGLRRAVLDDGRVFFDTIADLVPSDTNGQADVYEWVDGRARLVSTGTSETGSYYAGTDVTGHDVFFSTRERLVAQDRDDLVDVYDARVGGGIPSQALVSVNGAACADDSCQGPPAVALPVPSIASVTFPGTTGTTGRAVPAVVKVRGARTVVGPQGRLTVQVPAAGTISLSGGGIRSVTRRVAKGGTYSLTVSLTRKARVTLAKARRYKGAVRVGFKPAVGEASARKVALTFKAPKRARRATAKESAIADPGARR